MANGLMGLQDLLGQSSNAQSGSLLGGGIFTPTPPTRAQRRESLLANAINSQQTAAGRAGAAIGGLFGTALSGLGPGTPEEQRNEAIRTVQSEVAERGLDPMANPAEFGEFVSGRFQELGQPELATRTRLQIRQMMPEPQERRFSVAGGTELAIKWRHDLG